MKRISKLCLLAVLTLLSPAVWAEEVVLKIPTSSEQDRCGVELVLPEGDAKTYTVEKPDYQVRLTLAARAGSVKWTGKARTRGLKSVSACEGSGVIAFDPDGARARADHAQALAERESAGPGAGHGAPATPATAAVAMQEAKPARKKSVPEKKDYGLFYDQGDHLVELVEAGQYEDAERLFSAHKAGFFLDRGGLDRSSRMEKYAPQLKKLAEALNRGYRTRFEGEMNRLLGLLDKPHGESVWREWGAALGAGRALVSEYRAHPLLSMPGFADTGLQGLEASMLAAEQKIVARSIEVVTDNPPDLALRFLNGPYPARPDIAALLQAHQARVLSALQGQSQKEVSFFLRIFGPYLNPSMKREMGDLLLAKYDYAGTGEARLRKALKAHQEVSALGLNPGPVAGVRIVFAESVRQGSQPEVKFGSGLKPDAPLEVVTRQFSDLDARLEADFLVVLDISKATVERKAGWQKQHRSRQLAGHRNVPNSQYAEAKAAYELAVSSHNNANSQDCSRTKGYGCAITKSLLIASTGANMAEAQKKVYSTPEFLTEPIYRNYDYSTSRIDLRKHLSGRILVVDLGAMLYQEIPLELGESRSFPLVHDVSPEDTEYQSIMSRHKTGQDVDQYADQPVEVRLSMLIEKYLDAKSQIRSIASLEGFFDAVSAGKAIPGGVQVAAAAASEVPVAADVSIRKLQAELVEQRQQIKLQAQRERLEAELARLKDAGAEKFNDDLPALLQKALSAPTQPNLHVLSVGIADYADVPDVPYADRSAVLFAEVAKRVLGAREENVMLLTDAEATSGRLRGRLRTLLNRLKPTDQLVVYYAGHGVPSVDGKTAYLLAQDGGPGSYEEPDLQLENLYAEIAKSRVSRATLYIDACFSGRSGKDKIVFEGVGGITLVPKHSVRPEGKLSGITAGRSDQFSNQDKGHGHRLFGYHLMRAMLESPASATTGQLHAVLSPKVVSDSRKLGPEFEQDPELLGNSAHHALLR